MLRLAWLMLIATGCLPSLARADITPHDVVLTISYGNAPGALDTTRIRRDDPSRTLIGAFHRDAAGTFWLMPSPDVTGGRNLLLGFRDGALDSTIEFSGIAGDFLVTPDGVYSCSPSPSGLMGVVAHFAFDPLAPHAKTLRARLPATRELPISTAGSLQLHEDRPYWVTFDLRSAVPLDAGMRRGVIGSGAVAGIPTARGLVRQDAGVVTRDGARILEMYFEGSGTLIFVFDSGGFVVRRPGIVVPPASPAVFEIHDADGKMIRSVTTLPRVGRFGQESSPWLFEESGAVFQLVLAKEEAHVLRY